MAPRKVSYRAAWGHKAVGKNHLQTLLGMGGKREPQVPSLLSFKVTTPPAHQLRSFQSEASVRGAWRLTRVPSLPLLLIHSPAQDGDGDLCPLESRDSDNPRCKMLGHHRKAPAS